jgi:hypothetical protein
MKRIALLLLALFAFSFAAYGLTWTWAPGKDSMLIVSWWFDAARSGPRLHPDKLLYFPALIPFCELTASLGLDFIARVRLFNTLFASACVVLFFLVSHSMTANTPVSVATALLFGCSYTFWEYSGEIEGMSLSLFFLLLTFWILARYLENPRGLTIALVGISQGVAALLHLSHILFFPAVVAGIVIAHKEKTLRVRHLVGYGSALAGCVATAYFVVLGWALGTYSPLSLLQWIFSIKDAGPWGELHWDNFPGAVMGAFGAVSGGVRYLTAVLVGEDYTFLYYFRIFYLLSFIVGLICPFLLFLKEGIRVYRSHVLVIAICLSSYSLFALYWQPRNSEFWISALFPGWLLSSLVFKTMTLGKRPAREMLAYALPFFLLALLFASNVAKMRFLAEPENNPYFGQAKLIHRLANQDDVIMCDDWLSLYSFFLKKGGVPVRGDFRTLYPGFRVHRDSAQLERTFNLLNTLIDERAARGGHLYFTSTWRGGLDEGTLNSPHLRHFSQRFEPYFVPVGTVPEPARPFLQRRGRSAVTVYEVVGAAPSKGRG